MRCPFLVRATWWGIFEANARSHHTTFNDACKQWKYLNFGFWSSRVASVPWTPVAADAEKTFELVLLDGNYTVVEKVPRGGVQVVTKRHLALQNELVAEQTSPPSALKQECVIL